MNLTPEMIEAGLVVLRRYDYEPGEIDKGEVVAAIVKAVMAESSPAKYLREHYKRPVNPLEQCLCDDDR